MLENSLVEFCGAVIYEGYTALPWLSLPAFPPLSTSLHSLILEIGLYESVSD